MSYPPVRYTADEGYVGATLQPASSPPDLVSEGNEVRYLATQVSTDGEFGLYHYVMGAGARGPRPHFHRTISESFYILRGVLRLYDGRHWVDATAGDFLYVPVGGIHAFQNDSGARAEMLLLFAPGAPREVYFETLAAALARARAGGGPEPTPEQRRRFLAEHDQYDA